MGARLRSQLIGFAMGTLLAICACYFLPSARLASHVIEGMNSYASGQEYHRAESEFTSAITNADSFFGFTEEQAAAILHLLRARCRGADGNLDKAIEDWEIGIQQQPGWDHLERERSLHSFKAILYAGTSQLSQALASYDYLIAHPVKTINGMPYEGEIEDYVYRGDVHYRLGNYDLAKQDFTAYLAQFKPGHSGRLVEFSRFYRSLIHRKLGEELDAERDRLAADTTEWINQSDEEVDDEEVLRLGRNKYVPILGIRQSR